MIRPLGVVALAALLAGAAAGSTGGPGSSGAQAHGFAVAVNVPGQEPVVAAAATAPSDPAAPGQPFAYPADGSVVQIAEIDSSAQTAAGAAAVSSASADASGVSLLGGEITAALVSVHATATAGPLAAAGDTDGTAITRLTVRGRPVAPAPNLRVPLGDWGNAIVLEQTAVPGGSADRPTYSGSVTGLDVRLTAAHDGLPAGTRIVVGYAQAAAQAPPPPVRPAARPAPLVPAVPTAPVARPRRAPEPILGPRPSIVRRPPTVHPQLTAGHYVFPVYGPVSYVDTFGAPRADVTYHHGDDIFAPLGAPILAVADGLVYSVGWNSVGGNRLWLQDGEGNQFYYAHLSAFAPAARNGRFVTAGTVLGFVGNTGDAADTPYHLHFEVHPVSLLYLGYDGAVDPTRYLVGWQHLRDVSFTAARGWVPPGDSSSPAPKPGAILLGESDISGASGLDPGSLRRAMAAPVAAGAGG